MLKLLTDRRGEGSDLVDLELFENAFEFRQVDILIVRDSVNGLAKIGGRHALQMIRAKQVLNSLIFSNGEPGELLEQGVEVLRWSLIKCAHSAIAAEQGLRFCRQDR